MTAISQKKNFKITRNRRVRSSILALLIAFFGIILLLSIKSFPGHEKLKRSLLDRLVIVHTLKNDSSLEKTKPGTVLYVLGGTQTSLIYKFKIAADLYHRGICKKMILMSKPGITGYDTLLGRNLTNDEWNVKVLIALGVKKENIESIPSNKGLFGTFAEAASIADIAGQRGYRQVILVTAPYHTRRTWVTFSKFLKNRGITLYLYASDEHVRLKNLLLEYCKLVLYDDFVLPFYAI